MVPSLNVETGGPARSVSTLADAQMAAGLDVSVLCLDYQRHGRLLEPKLARLHVVPTTAIGRAMRGWSPAFAALARSLAQSHDIVHNHGLWMQSNRHARIAANASGKPLVSSPRGMLEAYSWQRSAWRKQLAFLAFERKNLASARLMHATSEPEARSIRNVLRSTPIAILPNVVESIAATRTSPPDRQILFLGRLDQKKGIDWLVDAWLRIFPAQSSWRLVIAGPCAMGYESELSHLHSRTAGREDIIWHSAVDGAAKWDLIDQSAAVVLPSRSENFGNVVAEAMLAGKPVLATEATPWSCLAHNAMGWWVPTDGTGIAAGLSSILATPIHELARMGDRARSFARMNFSPESIGSAWVDAYAYLVRGGAPPASMWTGK